MAGFLSFRMRRASLRRSARFGALYCRNPAGWPFSPLTRTIATIFLLSILY